MRTVNGWTNVGTENGTIKLSTKLYDYSQDATGFAGDDLFDDNFFDQEPSQETRHILTALRDDLFINDLALEYNTLFFTGLRKVLEEQTYVDWMFKTSFVNVTNLVRQLDQRKTYTTGTDSWIESYINEVKPFHSKLREYKLGYQGTDTQDGINTDFDNPPFYDADEGKIRNLNVSKDSGKLTEYPWQMWNDYHKKYVSSITLLSGGSGYTTEPTVTILGGTVGSTGPFQILGTSSSGSTSGTYGYYYPLFTSETQANIWDSQNGGSGASHTHTYDEYSGTFYMPTGSMNHGIATKSGTYKMYETPTTNAATAKATVVDGKVTKITLFGTEQLYINKWDSLKDLLDCATCSCWIPGIFGNLVKHYKNEIYIDGGFPKSIDDSDSDWLNIKIDSFQKISHELKLFLYISSLSTLSNEKVATELYNLGYTDSKNNSDYFNSLKIKHNH